MIAYTAMCMWEDALRLRCLAPYDATFNNLGTCEVRALILSYAEQCYEDYPANYEDPFDWDYVPEWMAENLTWSPNSIELTPKPDFFHLGADAE